MILDVLYPTIETYKAFCLASIWMLDIIGNKKNNYYDLRLHSRKFRQADG